MKTILTLIGATLIGTSALAGGYSEKKSGDLSNDGLNPTPVKMKLGGNVIDGTDGSMNGVVDRDYFTFKIAKGQVLQSIMLDPKSEIGGTFSFIGIEKGKQVTTDPNGNDPSALLGWAHYSNADRGTDLLPLICQGAGAKGCTPPLPAGSYSVWLQELSNGSFHYRFVFNVAAAADDNATIDADDE
jgi:hypothetical protein